MTDDSFLETTDKEILHNSICNPFKHISSCMIYNFALKMSKLIA